MAVPVGCLLMGPRCTGRRPDTLICGSGCDPGFACCGPAAVCAAAAVVFRMSAASRVEKAGTRRQRPRRRPLKLTGNTSRPGGDKRPVTAILADEVRFRPYADRTTTGLDSPGHPARRARALPLPVADLLARGSLCPAAFPGASLPVALWPNTHRLQLRGQPRHCVRHLHAHAPRSLLIPCGNHRWQFGRNP